MTRFAVVAVGSPRNPHLRDAIREYERRVGHYFRFEAVEVGAASLPDDRAGESRRREAEAIERRIPDDLELVALSREGKPWSTRDLAAYVADLRNHGRAGAVFVIGGAHGLGKRVLDRARIRLSLSAMTLPHEMARLFLTEQLYRSGTILRGEPYHKGP